MDLKTGEITRRRIDPDAGLQYEAGGKIRGFGTKFVVVATRTDFGRVIFGAEHVRKKGGGELGPVLELLDLILPRLPEMTGFAYDGAIHGVHMQHLLRKHGVLAIAKVPAEARRGEDGTGEAEESEIDPEITAGRGKEEKATPKGGLLEGRDIEVAPGRFRRLEIRAENGAAGTELINAEGDKVFEKFERLEVEIRRNKGTGEYRAYQTYRLPREYGGGVIRLRLHGDESDGKGPDHRPEILRAIPPEDPDFRRLYGRRSDIESINRSIENRLYWNRAHSLGHRSQLFDMLCFARTINAITKARFRAKRAEARSA